MAIIRFVFLLSIVGILVAAVSIAWPKITSKERPTLLTDIRDFALHYPSGKAFAEILGVMDEQNEVPMLSSDIMNFQGALMHSLTNAATGFVAKEASEQLARTFEQLSDDQKSIIRKNICEY